MKHYIPIPFRLATAGLFHAEPIFRPEFIAMVSICQLTAAALNRRLKSESEASNSP
jgi:hypothetical protein